MKITKYEWVKPKGFVYILDGGNGLYKIGMSKTPKIRIRTLGVCLPFDLVTVCLIGSDDYITLEQELHDVFASKRVRGEWFRLNNDDLEWLIEDAGAMGTSIHVSERWSKADSQTHLPYFEAKVGTYEI